MRRLTELRPVYVVGVGWHRYQYASETNHADLALTAVREALHDAGLPWEAVDESFVATMLLGSAIGRPMLAPLGAHGKPLVHVENASASGSAAFRLACVQVAAGISDVALAVGVDKPGPVTRADTGIHALGDDIATVNSRPANHFSLLTDAYMAAHGVTEEDIARIAVKNHRHGSLNPNAQRQKERTLEEVLGSRRLTRSLTSLQVCPVGEGAAAAIVAGEEAVARWGLDPSKPIRVAASAAASEAVLSSDQEVSRDVITRALSEAQVPPEAIDVFEMHDAFALEEALYVEASGIARPGEYLAMLRDGCFDIGGRCAVSPSGGLIAMGHPIGPTGIGQIGELTRQLRHAAGPRQHGGARVGLAHMVGIGAVGYAHVLVRP